MAKAKSEKFRSKFPYMSREEIVPISFMLNGQSDTALQSDR